MTQGLKALLHHSEPKQMNKSKTKITYVDPNVVTHFL
jgi:hypothetical protein